MFDMLETTSDDKYRIVVSRSVLEKSLVCGYFDKEEVLVDIDGNTFKYFSDVYKEYEIFLNVESIRKSFIFKLHNDKIFYRIGCGMIDKSKCLIGSKKELIPLDYGFEYNIGMYLSFLPVTVVSDAILVGVENYMLKQNFDFLKDDLNDKYKIDTDLKLSDLSFNILFSKIVTKSINLNYGVSMSIRDFSIVDRYNYYEIKDRDYSFLGYGGVTFSLSKKERINFCISYSLKKELNWFVSFLLCI